jgi:hypothetical protein
MIDGFGRPRIMIINNIGPFFVEISTLDFYFLSSRKSHGFKEKELRQASL